MLEEIQKEIERLSQRRHKNWLDGVPTQKLDIRLAELYDMKRAVRARKAGEQLE